MGQKDLSQLETMLRIYSASHPTARSVNRLHTIKLKRLTRRFRNATYTTLVFEGVILPLYDSIVKNCMKLNRQEEAPYAAS